jgi:hypothetical protein
MPERKSVWGVEDFALPDGSAADFSSLAAVGTAFAGVKVRITYPAGTSRGTSIVRRRLGGISTVCVILME